MHENLTAPFDLPPLWEKRKTRLNLNTRFNFVRAGNIRPFSSEVRSVQSIQRRDRPFDRVGGLQMGALTCISADRLILNQEEWKPCRRI